jgi:hypothetical protein
MVALQQDAFSSWLIWGMCDFRTQSALMASCYTVLGTTCGTQNGIAYLDRFQRQLNVNPRKAHSAEAISLIMTTHEGFMVVQKELFDCMRRHCENCCGLNIPLQDLFDDRVVAVTELSPNSKKRKASHLFEEQPPGPYRGSVPTMVERLSYTHNGGIHRQLACHF